MLLAKPDLQLSQTNFSQTSADWDARYLASQSVWSLEPNQFVVSDLSELPVGQMVDIAGGEGRKALGFAGQVADGAQGFFATVLQALAMLQKRLPGLGQADFAGAAIEQAGLQALFQAGDLAADLR